MIKLNRILLLLIITFVFYGCPRHWTEAIKNGSVDKENFNTTIDINISNKLIIVPVKINSKTYQFLLDTGAPLSISKELQNEFNFKTVSKGSLKDSDNSRISVDYVGIPKINLGDVGFANQVAFVWRF